MSHNGAYGQPSRGVKGTLGGSTAKNVKNFFPAVQTTGKKNVLPKLLSQSQDASGADKSDSSGLDVGVCTVQGRRPYQEDQYAVCRFLKDPQGSNENTPETHYFGVFDGHAGGKCSKAICSTIPYQFCRDESFATKLPVALKRAIQKTNEQFLEVAGRMRLNDGSTAVQIAIRGKTMTIANVGDSRAVLISGKKGITLTEDHKPSAPAEHRRIASFGGTVTYNTGIARVAGVLAVSRAFGNYTIRNLIRADPDVTQRELTEQDHYLVLASDGLWDVFRAAEVADICYTYERHGVQRIADYLVQMSLTRGSMDNITAVVVSLSRYYNRMTQLEAGGASLNTTLVPSQLMSARLRPPREDDSLQRETETVHHEGASDFSAPPSSSSGGGGTPVGLQRPASSGVSGGDKERQHARPQPSAKSRPSSGYAVLNSNTSHLNSSPAEHNLHHNGGLFGQKHQTEIFEDDETLHGDLSDFNKSVDFSALSQHVSPSGQQQGDVGGRMHQRLKAQADLSSNRLTTQARPRSSQQAVKQSTDSNLINGSFGDRSSGTPLTRPPISQDSQAQAQRQQYTASPSNIMKRMFSRGKNQENVKQMFSNIGDDVQGSDDSKALNNTNSNSNSNSGNANFSGAPTTSGEGSQQQQLNAANRRPGSAMSSINTNAASSSAPNAGTLLGGATSAAPNNRSNKFTIAKTSSGNRNVPLAFTGGSVSNDQSSQLQNSNDGLSRANNGTVVERVQNMGYSRGLHSPINTKSKK